MAVENWMHTPDLHATVLHLLGIGHAGVTYRYAGRNFRLTDGYGVVRAAWTDEAQAFRLGIEPTDVNGFDTRCTRIR